MYPRGLPLIVEGVTTFVAMEWSVAEREPAGEVESSALDRFLRGCMQGRVDRERRIRRCPCRRMSHRRVGGGEMREVVSVVVVFCLECLSEGVKVIHIYVCWGGDWGGMRAYVMLSGRRNGRLGLLSTFHTPGGERRATVAVDRRGDGFDSSSLRVISHYPALGTLRKGSAVGVATLMFGDGGDVESVGVDFFRFLGFGPFIPSCGRCCVGTDRVRCSGNKAAPWRYLGTSPGL